MFSFSYMILFGAMACEHRSKQTKNLPPAPPEKPNKPPNPPMFSVFKFTTSKLLAKSLA